MTSQKLNWLAIIAVLALWLLASTLDYQDARAEDCSRQAKAYDAMRDKCVPHPLNP